VKREEREERNNSDGLGRRESALSGPFKKLELVRKREASKVRKRVKEERQMSTK
jgi:hypothetical protein